MKVLVTGSAGFIGSALSIRLLFGLFPMHRTLLHPGEYLRFWTYKDLRWWLNELTLKDRNTIFIYEGIPILNKIFRGFLGAGFVVEVKKLK